jgi:hypothetical protein
MKHLIGWLSGSLVFGQQNINMHCHLMPPNHHIVLFPEGFASYSHILGKKHKNICWILLGLIIDIHLTSNGSSAAWVVKAMHALLDFLYLAQLPSQTTDTIAHLKQSLVAFHENKDVFVGLRVRKHFNVPKIHSLLHYSLSILLFGTTDNYNTKQTEQLHIDFTKEAYHATNHKDEYNQMTIWLEHREKLQQHKAFIDWRQQQLLSTSVPRPRPISGPPHPNTCYLKMTDHLMVLRVSFKDIVNNYGAVDFQDALGDFLTHLKEPHLSGRVLRREGVNTLIPFNHVPVFQTIKFENNDGAIIDSIHIRLEHAPEQAPPHGQITPARFDTALVQVGQQPDNMRQNQGSFKLIVIKSRTDFSCLQVTG